MVGGQVKLDLLQGSRGLIFPVLWHEPFGLAVIESLYFGCPVYATPYGALPELVPPACGVLSAGRGELADSPCVRAVSMHGPAMSRRRDISAPPPWPAAICRFTSGFWTVKPCMPGRRP
jgi:hypothetical protein